MRQMRPTAAVAMALAVVALTARAADFWEFNLAKTATMKSSQPYIAPSQGSTNGLTDGSEYNWGDAVVSGNHDQCPAAVSGVGDGADGT